MKKYIKGIIISLVAVFVLLFGILIIHIVNAPSLEIDHPTTQIARIDYDKNLSPEQISLIKKQAKSTFGIINPSFNTKNNALVFLYNTNETTSNNIEKSLNNSTKIKGNLMRISEELANKKVCPVMEPNSLKYKFSLAVQRTFK